MELSQEPFSESHLNLGKWVSGRWGLGDEEKVWVGINQGWATRALEKRDVLGMVSSNLHTKFLLL